MSARTDLQGTKGNSTQTMKEVLALEESPIKKSKTAHTIQQHQLLKSKRSNCTFERVNTCKKGIGESAPVRTQATLRRQKNNLRTKRRTRLRLPKPTEQDLVEITRAGSLSKLLETVKRVENVTLFGEKGAREKETENTLLHIATKFNHLAIAETLLLLKADPDPRNKDESTPLCYALREKAHIFVIEMLIRHKASPVAENALGKTPQILLEENPYLKKKDKIRSLLGMESYRVSAIRPLTKRVNKIRWLDETYKRTETLDKDTLQAYRHIWNGITNFGLRLHKDQLLHLLSACGMENFGEADIANMMDQLDMNQDGKVDFNDFLVWISISSGEAIRYQVPVRSTWKRAECERSIFIKPFEMLSPNGQVVTPKAYRYLGAHMSSLGSNFYPQNEFEVNKIFSRFVDDFQPHNHLSGLELDTFCAMVENEVDVKNFHKPDVGMIKARTLGKYQRYVDEYKREHNVATPVSTTLS